MEFGKVANLNTIDFTLPPDHPATERVLEKHFRMGKLKAHVGCPIWANKSWIGKLYPVGAKDKDLLKFYSRKFNSIELNSTHYKLPDGATLARWKQMAAPGFKFCPKFPQVISHEKMLEEAEIDTEIFCETMLDLGNNLGVSFLQLPPYFEPKHLPLLESYLKLIPKGFAVAVEFRHPDWFTGSKEAEAGFDLLEAEGISTVLTDVAGRRDVLHMRLTTNIAFIRFIGNGLHPTDYERADDWMMRLKNWKDNGLQEVYFFTHEPDNMLDPDLGAYIINGLNSHLGAHLAPINFQPYGVQGTLF